MKKRLIAVLMAITLTAGSLGGVPVVAAEVAGEGQTSVQKEPAEETASQEVEPDAETKGTISEENETEQEDLAESVQPGIAESEEQNSEAEDVEQVVAETEEEGDETENAAQSVTVAEGQSSEAKDAEPIVAETEEEDNKTENVAPGISETEVENIESEETEIENIESVETEVENIVSGETEVSEEKKDGQIISETEEKQNISDKNDPQNTVVTEPEEQGIEILPSVTIEGITEEIQDDACNASTGWDAKKIASLPIVETDVTSASDGCFMMGLAGKYVANQQAFLNRMNEIRQEACKEGVTNPLTGKPLTMNDYVPLKWSYGLEEIARIRAAESALTGDHVRTNDKDASQIDLPYFMSAECLAWNYSESVTYGIEQWYEEKEYWLNGDSSSSGHYLAMINPAIRYVGGGTFCSPYARYYNTTSAEFSIENEMDESFVKFSGECIQMLEVADSHLNGNPSIMGTLSGVKGDEQQLCVTVNVQYNGIVFSSSTDGFLIKDGVKWSSSDSNIASVSDAGVVKAGKCGSAKITASLQNGKKATANFTVNHVIEKIPAVKATREKTGLTEGERCVNCGKVIKEQKTVATLTGSWKKNSKGWWYSWSDGSYAKNSFETIGGKTYYFDASGYMKTGWQKIDGKWYYFASSGAMQTGWIKLGKVWYYMNDKGVMQTGWQKMGGKWYYFTSGGAMQTGWIKLGKVWYYLNDNGAMQTGWQKIGGKWYYFAGGGSMQTGWKKIGGKWYYFAGGGSMQTGWQKIGGKWYYLAAGGAMLTGWQKISGKWYYLAGSGAMLTGWQKINGKWYYLAAGGAMVSNKWVGNYYLTGNGSMATSTWVGPYYVGDDGKWIPGYSESSSSSSSGSSSSSSSGSSSSSSGGSSSSSSGGSSNIVYWTTNGTVYHSTPNCRSLANSKDIKQGTVEESGKSEPCKNCYH